MKYKSCRRPSQAKIFLKRYQEQYYKSKIKNGDINIKGKTTRISED